MADEADLAAIRAFVASGGQIGVDKSGNPVVPESVVTPEPEPAPIAPTPAPQAPEPEPQQKPAQPKPPTPKRKGKTLIGRISDGLGDWAANVPTPGGNLALVLILVFFAFAIIPVNAGRTRLQLIWDVLTGNAELPGQGSASGPTAQQIGSAIQAGATGGVLGNTPIGGAIGAGLVGGALPGLIGSGSGGNPSNIPDPASLSGSGANPLALLEAPRGDW